MSGGRWLSRRNVLRGAGVALALPWLESLAPRLARGQAAPQRRSFVAMYFPCGVAERWKPAATGSGAAWALSPILEPLGPLKSHVNVLSNVGNYGPFSGHVEPSHGNLTGAVLTCTRPTNNFTTQTWTGGTSVDQVIAKSMGSRTKLDSLQVGLSTLDSYGDGVPLQFSRSISWRSPTEPLYKLVSPQAVFDRIVSAGGVGALTSDRRPANTSVLDYVLAHATTVKGELGPSDRARMDQFLTSVRDLEKNIQSVGTAAGCTVGPRPTEDYGVANVPPGYNRGTHADLMIDLVVMALQCDVTRVVSFMLDDSRSDFVYNFLTERHFSQTTSTPGTATVGGLHGVSSAGNANDGWATINRWFVEKLARLCGKLQAIPDGAGTLLDSATVWFGSEMHGGNHDALDLPIVTVGGGGGALRTDQSIDFALTPRRTERLSNLYLTFLRGVFGLPDQSFGTGGRIPDVQSQGAPPNAYGDGTALIPELLA
jgi:hypothetical protein